MADGFKVNFSSEDLTSEATSFEALPSGDYICNVTGVELVKVKSEKNRGKPAMNVELTVAPENGAYVKRKFWKMIFLFELEYSNGTKGNFVLAQFLKACGFAEALKTGNVPAGPAYMGKQVIAVVAKRRQTEEYGGGFRNEVQGFRAVEGQESSKSSGSLLPS